MQPRAACSCSAGSTRPVSMTYGATERRAIAGTAHPNGHAAPCPRTGTRPCGTQRPGRMLVFGGGTYSAGYSTTTCGATRRRAIAGCSSPPAAPRPRRDGTTRRCGTPPGTACSSSAGLAPASHYTQRPVGYQATSNSWIQLTPPAPAPGADTTTRRCGTRRAAACSSSAAESRPTSTTCGRTKPRATSGRS